MALLVWGRGCYSGVRALRGVAYRAGTPPGCLPARRRRWRAARRCACRPWAWRHQRWPCSAPRRTARADRASSPGGRARADGGRTCSLGRGLGKAATSPGGHDSATLLAKSLLLLPKAGVMSHECLPCLLRLSSIVYLKAALGRSWHEHSAAAWFEIRSLFSKVSFRQVRMKRRKRTPC